MIKYQISQFLIYGAFCITFLFVIFQSYRIWQYKKLKAVVLNNAIRKVVLNRLAPNKMSKGKHWLKFSVFTLAVYALFVALANPQIGTALQTVKREGIDIVFAIDVSKSMLAEDIAPNRIEKAKRIVSEVINNLASDRVGIIAYAGGAFPQLPITTDYAAAKMFLQSMNTDMLSSQGTAIGGAINLASQYFDDDQQTNRVLLLISDGEDHAGAIDNQVLQNASENNIQIFTIGIGEEKGAPIPIKKNGVLQSFKKDGEGQVVISKLNPSILQEIAVRTNGAYISGNNTEGVVEEIDSIIDKIDKTEFEAKEFASYKDQFQWLIGIALVLLIIDSLLLERKTSWIKKLNLFNEKV